jgi:hypothetical protein
MQIWNSSAKAEKKIKKIEPIKDTVEKCPQD